MRLFMDDDGLCSETELKQNLAEAIKTGGIDPVTKLPEFIRDCMRVGLQPLAYSEMTCRRFLYMLASSDPISLNNAEKEYEIQLHRKYNRLIVTDSDSDTAIAITDPENAAKLYRFIECDQAECQEI